MQLDLVVIHLYNVPDGQLRDAHSMAIAFGLNPHHYDQEYLFCGVIEQERNLVIFPVGVEKIRIPVHLGELCVPAAFIARIGPSAEQVREAVAMGV
jgi:hypothetical protein